ncbi:uncharacterized protein LOC6558382 isoform X2 [Drosophila grimshawi]|uniref:uncharacterized protein LOC6558382 isoform X2 n=1 Tax=Drosophila grimshawi TaxID=7222 RepID=UPI000C86F2AC|nr:uncharacterized protein LOC6558382 isoform X2 [Drosophila grimshawi]
MGKLKLPNKKKFEQELEKVDLISEEEWQRREHHQLQRIQDVKICLGFISESITDYKQLVEEQSKADQWNRYLSCDKLPRVKYPPEIRNMISEMRDLEARDVDSGVNWQLSVDECSLLTQDIFRKDLTRQTLRTTLCPQIGQLYDKHIQQILTTLDRIEVMLNSEYEMKDVPQQRHLDIIATRQELIEEIDVYLDKLTYRIVAAPCALKTSSDGIMENYCYKSPNYNLQIWWLSDVPFRINHLSPPVMLADLDCVGVRVQIPLSVLCDNLTLRCVHSFFDHVSESAKSFGQQMDMCPNALNGGMMDIEDCLINEWLMQVDIMDKMINKLELKIMEYKKFMSQMSVKVAPPKWGEIDQKKRKSDKSSKSKNVKKPKEPQNLPDGMFPDPYDAFLEQEQQEFDEFLDKFMNPLNLKLGPHEVNLRYFNMIGGLYSLFFVPKPKHTHFQKFNITLHKDGRILHRSEEVLADMGDVGEKTDHRSPLTRRSAYEDAKNLNLKLQDDELPFFWITFQLPEYLCRFGEPLACHFIEEEVEEVEPEQLEVDIEEHRSKKKKVRKSSRGPETDANNEKTKSIEKNGKISIDECFMLRRPTQSIIAPKAHTPRNIYRPPSLVSLQYSTLKTFLRTRSQDVTLHNFDVTGHLTSHQIHDLQRHCIPRILSSFKFPMEFKMEKSEEKMAKKKLRDKRCTLFRRHQVELPDDQEDDEPEYFTYEKQAGPERIYPVYNLYDKVQFQQSSSSSEVPSEPDLRKTKENTLDIGNHSSNVSFYGVLDTLNAIKEKYKSRPKTILNQQQFAPKTIVRTYSIVEPFDSPTGRSKPAVRIATMNSKFFPSSRTGRLPYIRPFDFESDNENHESESSTLSMQGEIIQLTKKSIVKEPESERIQKPERLKVKHWTTKYIKRTEYDPQSFTFKIQTDRLGIFGFACKRYEHFPFRHWQLQYNEEK